MKPDLLTDIEEHMTRRGIGEHRFGILAANNGRLVERLRIGGRNWPETIAKVRKYLDDNKETKSINYFPMQGKE